MKFIADYFVKTRTFLFVFFCLSSALAGVSQHAPDDLSFKDRLQPLAEENIFKTEEYFITTLTVNPAIAQGGDGRYYLVVKGDKPNATGFVRNQAIAISDSPTGPFEMQPRAVIDDKIMPQSRSRHGTSEG